MNEFFQNNLNLRKMTETDLDAVIEIEKGSFPEPYTYEIMQNELKINCAELIVAQNKGQVVAYIDFWIIHDEIELISIAVHPEHRKLGAGKLLMNNMIDLARTKNIHIIYLDVRESNLTAQKLYRGLGFEQVGLRKRYYKNNKENALIMVKEL